MAYVSSVALPDVVVDFLTRSMFVPLTGVTLRPVNGNGFRYLARMQVDDTFFIYYHRHACLCRVMP